MTKGSSTILTKKCGNYLGKVRAGRDKSQATIYGRNVRGDKSEFGVVNFSRRTILDSLKNGSVPRTLRIAMKNPNFKDRVADPNVLCKSSYY